ncbi:hypothetical protein [Pedobacter ginsengisoli]|uniref:hypothetical protein n=1 Tax=Pedobacter ginsengisoli TaxID=363852 RepID=UPI00254C2969|nr:hypothetical protein [Pedobacter ginsengisoli]
MKMIYKTGIVAAIVLILSANTSIAQENESGESVRKQYVNNNVPGAKYAPEKKSNGKEETDKPKTYNKGDFKSTLDGGKSQSGGATARRSAQKSVNAAARATQKPLPSDQPAVKEEIKKIDPPKPPSQGDEKKKD